MGPLLAAFLLASAARAQDSGAIGVADGRGSFYSVTNRQGRAGYFQITKLAPQGGVLWNVPFNPGEDVRASVVAVDKEGSLLVAGTLRSGRRTYTLLAKFTPFGAFSWKQLHDAGSDSAPTALAVDADGNAYVASTVDADGTTFLRVARFGPTGAYFWGSNYKNGRSAYARAMTVDPSGDARVTAEVSFGDLSRGLQTRQVLFTTYGAVVPQ
ncbi:MAG: hypothetical protein HY553_15660 [Elusimicrobia bacterium]|nr:hypothetical protein [Elusimicrobiota bacterium]